MLRAHPVEAIRAAERPLIEAAVAAGDPDAVMRRAASGVAHHTAALLRRRTGGVYGRCWLLYKSDAADDVPAGEISVVAVG